MALVQKYGSIDDAVSHRCRTFDAKPAALRKLEAGRGDRRGTATGWPPSSPMRRLDFTPADNLRRPVKPELYDLFLRLEFTEAHREVRSVAAQHQPEETGGRWPPRWRSLDDGGAGAGAAGAVAGRRAVFVYGLPDLQRTGGGLRRRARSTVRTAELLREPVRRKLATTSLRGSVRRRRQKGGAQREGPDARAAGAGAARRGLCVRHGAGGVTSAMPPPDSYDYRHSCFSPFMATELPKPAHLEPEAFTSLLGDVRAGSRRRSISHTALRCRRSMGRWRPSWRRWT